MNNQNTKLIIFDLDGVLIDAKDIHFNTLNDALEVIAGKKYTLTIEEHHHLYDGLKTQQKLQLLTEKKQLPPNLHNDIWNTKQNLTTTEFRKIKPRKDLRDILEKLKEKKYKIACCSNSIRKTILLALSKLDIIEYFDIIISNEDTKYSKPYPETYWTAMIQAGSLPENTLIIEDSPVGLQGAYRTGANILRVKNSKDLIYNKIISKLQTTMTNNKQTKWQDEKLNVLIPMAGAGSRFEKAGYTFPKPLIDIKGKPMIQIVSDNLNIEANFIFLVQKNHREKYNLDTLLNLIVPNCTIVEVNGLTEGAACTTLLAKKYINNDNPLIIANSDQYLVWNSCDFMYKMQEQDVDAGIVTFESTHPKWSYAKIDENGLVTEVAEKNPISNIATAGVYFWKKGSEYVRCVEQMISENTRVNNEFYVCPAFNEAIKHNKRIKTFNIEKMYGLGTPEDLINFNNNFNYENNN
jgi:HAD superfamily hydrolase (TIGR01509 family)